MDKLTQKQAKEIIELRDELKILKLLKCPHLLQNYDFKKTIIEKDKIIHDLKEEIRVLMIDTKEAK